jgi:uncharacterized protein (TIGR02646 family)
MKYFKKNDPPESLANWLIEYKDTLEKRYDSKRPIKNIWQELGTPLDVTDLADTEQLEAIQRTDLINSELDASLLREQGYICCYCGKRIPEKKIVREHFEDKKHHRRLVFQYSNLFAACEGGKEEPFSIGQSVKLQNGEIIEIKGFEDVITVLNQSLENITIEDIKNHSENEKKELKKGDKIYYPNPPHCDSSKGDKQDIIINPTIQIGCEYWFTYKSRLGTTQIEVIPQGKNQALVLKTIDLLKLNVDTLANNKHRNYALKKGQERISVLADTINAIEDYDIKTAVVQDYIENEVYIKIDNKLDPFCFVTASIVWNYFL